jgi:acetoin utilization deacetylase AcuC-like enzyme
MTLLISHPAFLEHDTGAYHPERADRLRAIERVLQDERFAALKRVEAPRGSEAAIIPVNADTCAATATAPGDTPTSRANEARAAPTDSSHPMNPVRPCRHSSAAAWSASNAPRGGRPYEAVLR